MTYFVLKMPLNPNEPTWLNPVEDLHVVITL